MFSSSLEKSTRPHAAMTSPLRHAVVSSRVDSDGTAAPRHCANATPTPSSSSVAQRAASRARTSAARRARHRARVAPRVNRREVRGVRLGDNRDGASAGAVAREVERTRPRLARVVAEIDATRRAESGGGCLRRVFVVFVVVAVGVDPAPDVPPYRALSAQCPSAPQAPGQARPGSRRARRAAPTPGTTRRLSFPKRFRESRTRSKRFRRSRPTPSRRRR